MKKNILFFVALSFVLGLGSFGSSLSYADTQINEGQNKSASAKKYFSGRFGRTGAVATAGANALSKDMVVIWDSTSKDGVSILTTTTSHDNLRAGILLEDVPGSSRDNTAAIDEAYPNWGRVQTWGLHADALSVGNIAAGDRLCTSGTAGRVATCVGSSVTSADGTVVGIALEASTTAIGNVDMMVSTD